MHTKILMSAQRSLLEPWGLSTEDLHTVLAQLMGKHITEADLYFQSLEHESLVLEQGIIKSGSSNISQGAGLRAIVGEKTGFAYTEDLDLDSLMQAALAAKAIGSQSQIQSINSSLKGRLSQDQKALFSALYTQNNPLYTMSSAAKVDLLKQVEGYTRSLDARVDQVSVSLNASFETVLILNSEGVYNADLRPMLRLNINVIVLDAKGQRESGSAGGGGRYSYDYFSANQLQKALSYARAAVHQALLNLEAKPAPTGMMPVILGPGWPGVLLHEAVGHGLEGDFNRKGTSVYSGRIGEQVASILCTVVDDGTIENRRGSLNIDDEGTPTQRNVLIENGILKGYMQDKLNAKLMGINSTGNGRRESYAHMPMPRMTNTFMLSGPHSPEEMIKTVKKGLYAVNFGGGSVDISSGKFVFSSSEAYMIENGKITYPVKGATLIGNGPEVMKKISMVGNDLALDPGIGNCGKDGQTVPVGVGQPTLKIDELTVGGTAQ